MTTYFTEDLRNLPLDKQRTKDPISQRVIKLLQDHKRKHGQDATRIIFSEEGFLEAKREGDGSLAGGNADGTITTYMGIPYSVHAGQLAPIRVQSTQSYPPNSTAIRFAMHGTFGKLGHAEPKTMIELVAQSLDAATLCDIIRKWLDGDDATHWGEFEKALDRAVTEHGRFE